MTNSTSQSAQTEPTAQPPAPPRRGRRSLGLVFLAMILVGAASGGYFLWLDLTAPVPPEVDVAHCEPVVAEAIRKARALVAASPRDANAWGEYAMALHAHDLYRPAQECYARAEELDPANPMWPYLRGDCCTLDGDPRDAAAHFRRAVGRSGADPSAHLRLGEFFVAAGQLDEAAALFGEIQRADPQNPRANLGLARIELARGNARGSLTHVSNCLAVAGDIPEACLLLAEVYHDLGEHDLAADASRRAKLVSSTPWPDTYLHNLFKRQQGILAVGQRATAHYNAGRREEAIQELASYVAQQPESPTALGSLGRMYVLCDRPADAEPYLRKSLALDPELVEVRYYLATALMKLDKLNDAAAEFRTVTARKPEHSDAHSRLSQCLYKLGDKAGSAAALQEAVRYTPNNDRSQKNLAVLLLELHRYEDAVRHFELAAALAPKDRQIPVLLARAKEAASRSKK
jgi:tetratricopeptide (TPR) repeat protein